MSMATLISINIILLQLVARILTNMVGVSQMVVHFQITFVFRFSSLLCKAYARARYHDNYKYHMDVSAKYLTGIIL